MNEPVWNKFLTERDKQVFAAAGFATRQGFGRKPAIMVVDVNYAFCFD
jgi:maleamate amidohydrolase